MNICNFEKNKIKVLWKKKKFVFIIPVHLIPFVKWIFQERIWYDHTKRINNNTSRKKTRSGFVFSLIECIHKMCGCAGAFTFAWWFFLFIFWKWNTIKEKEKFCKYFSTWIHTIYDHISYDSDRYTIHKTTSYIRICIS